MPEINSNLPEGLYPPQKEKGCVPQTWKKPTNTVWPGQLHILNTVLFIENYSRDQQKQKWNLGSASSCLMCLVILTKLSAKAGCFFHTRLPTSVKEGVLDNDKHLLNLGHASTHQREKMEFGGWWLRRRLRFFILSCYSGFIPVGVQVNVKHWKSSIRQEANILSQILVASWVSQHIELKIWRRLSQIEYGEMRACEAM